MKYHIIGSESYGFGIKIDDHEQLLITHPASKLENETILKQIEMSRFCIIGKEAWLSIYEVLKPLLVS